MPTFESPFTSVDFSAALIHREVALACADRPPLRCRICSTVRQLAASIVAFGAQLCDSVRYGTRPQPVTGRVWLAAYGEWSNRTKHVLSLAGDMEQPVPLVLVGRPRKPAREVASLFSDNLASAEFNIIRPISAGACVRSLSAIARGASAVRKCIKEKGCDLPWRDLVGIFYRVQLGCVHRNWWRTTDYRPDVVIFGHTGNADVVALEQELQLRGTKTVHLFHGFSNGLPYTGISDLAVTKCEHDASWHRDIGGYGTTTAVAAGPPPLSTPSRQWALLTNYAHPTAFTDIARGVALERSAMEIVVSVARDAGLSPGSVQYRPHPALMSLPEHCRDEVQERALQLGLASWPRDLELSRLGEFALVITTPSTVISDALLAGTVPIVLDLAGADEGSVYAEYPFTARSAAELQELSKSVLSDRERAFAQAWDAVGPAIVPVPAQIAQLATGKINLD